MATPRRASVDMYLHPCHRACRHCFASQGTSVGGVMRVEDFCRYTNIIQDAACGASPFFSGWELIPFADGLHHPDIITLLAHMEALGNTSLQGLASDCWRIAHDPGWEALLDSLREYHTVSFQITLYGMEQTHDWFAGKRGSFAATALAVDRLSAKGFEIHWVVTLTEKNAPEINSILRWIKERMVSAAVCINTINFSGRGRQCVDLAVSPRSLALLSPEARGCLYEDLRTEREWWQLAADNQFPPDPRWHRLRQLVLLLIAHDGTVTGGIGGRFALGHLDETPMAEIVEKHDTLVLPAYAESQVREQELLAFIAQSDGPRSEDTLLTARDQMWVWERRGAGE